MVFQLLGSTNYSRIHLSISRSHARSHCTRTQKYSWNSFTVFTLVDGGWSQRRFPATGGKTADLVTFRWLDSRPITGGSTPVKQGGAISGGSEQRTPAKLSVRFPIEQRRFPVGFRQLRGGFFGGSTPAKPEARSPAVWRRFPADFRWIFCVERKSSL
jgi:hypothetical protein